MHGRVLCLPRSLRVPGFSYLSASQQMSQAVGSVSPVETLLATPSHAQTSAAFARTWNHIDLQGQILGRVATRIAVLLMGKHKPVYDPSNDCGDYVVVTNCRAVQVTGKKAEQKVYRQHTGWKLKTTTYQSMMDKTPEMVRPLPLPNLTSD
jgi:ribosomal protein L13